jgi:hypothetical protein
MFRLATYRHQGGQHLRAQLDDERPVEDIIQEGHGRDRHRGLDDAQEIRVGQAREGRIAVQHGDAGQEGQHDSDAAALGRRPVMRLARRRRVHHPDGDHHADDAGGEQHQQASEFQVAQDGGEGHAARVI